MIASVALVHDLTLVTHNTADYQHVPGLRLDESRFFNLRIRLPEELGADRANASVKRSDYASGQCDAIAKLAILRAMSIVCLLPVTCRVTYVPSMIKHNS